MPPDGKKGRQVCERRTCFKGAQEPQEVQGPYSGTAGRPFGGIPPTGQSLGNGGFGATQSDYQAPDLPDLGLHVAATIGRS